MCGRYSLYSESKVAQKFGYQIKPSYNIVPGNKVYVLNDGFSIKSMFWGFNYKWIKKNMLINARLESINNSSFYSNFNRCIFIADGYFEWQRVDKKKIQYFHYLKDKLIFMAGFCTDTNAVIITIQSYYKITHIHNRQPLIIDENSLQSWLKDKKIIPIDNNTINYYRVSNKINNAKNNNKDLLLKIN